MPTNVQMPVQSDCPWVNRHSIFMAPVFRLEPAVAPLSRDKVMSGTSLDPTWPWLLALELHAFSAIPKWLLYFQTFKCNSNNWGVFGREPLLVTICRRVAIIAAADFDANSVPELQGQRGIQELEPLSERLQFAARILWGPLYSWSASWNTGSAAQCVRDLWKELSRPSTLSTLLLVRCTKGSLQNHHLHFPLSTDLMIAFQEPHAKRVSTRPSKAAESSGGRSGRPAARRVNTHLTVGARALAKHCGRSAASWWGSGLGASSGPEPIRNAYALRKVTDLLQDATWVNFHVVPSAKDSNVAAVAKLDAGANHNAVSAASSTTAEKQCPGFSASQVAQAAALSPGGGTKSASVPVSVLEMRCSTGHGARWYIPAIEEPQSCCEKPTSTTELDLQATVARPSSSKIDPDMHMPATVLQACEDKIKVKKSWKQLNYESRRYWEQLRLHVHSPSIASVAATAAWVASNAIDAASEKIHVPPRSNHTVAGHSDLRPMLQFRGFLEPTGLAAGHETGWKS